MILKHNLTLKSCLAALLLVGSRSLYCAAMVFTAPGLYALGNSISYVSAGLGDTIFEIASDEAVLDLGGYIISQDPALANGPLNGIVIDPGFTNVTIILVQDCLSFDHVSSGTAAGYYYQGCTDCLTESNVATSINGAVDLQTYGFYTSDNSRCAFVKNVASRNGSSANGVNQFFGFNSFSNSVVDVVTSGPGNISGPWTNIGLI